MGSEELERLHQEIESLRAEVRQLRESTAKFVNGSVARDSKAQPEESRPGKGLAGELEEIEHEPERFKSFIREHPYYVAILLVIACAVAGGIYAAWRYLESYEVTSDARVVGDISPISSQVPGTVTKVLVNNDQRVQAGQPLVQLDASEYKLLVDRSRAMRDGARGRRSCPFAEQGGPGRNSLPLMATSPVMRWTRRGTWRQPHGRRWMRRLPRNTPLTPLSAGAVKVERHHRQRAGCGDSRGANRKCRRASAALPAGARHCPDRNLRIEANFKETQLRHVNRGKPVTIHVDALGRDLRGTVEGIAPATRSEFSLLPAENASGNYVKVVQRVTVTIALDLSQDLARLMPGMSVEPKVWVKCPLSVIRPGRSAKVPRRLIGIRSTIHGR